MSAALPGARQRRASWLAAGAFVCLGALFLATHDEFGVGYRYRTYSVSPDTADDGAAVRASTGFAVREYAPLAGAAVPGVVLLHGYMADATMMERLYAEELVRRGLLVVSIERATDYAESGSATVIEPGVRATLALVERLRHDPRVDPDHIAILGHSYGAAMAIKAACLDWGIAATVALTTALQPIEYVNHACPRNLLLIAGNLDPFNTDAQQRMLLMKATRGETDAVDTLSGDAALGNAREYVQIAGEGHVSVLTSLEARQRSVAWLETALLGVPTNRPLRVFPAFLLACSLLAAVVFVESVVATLSSSEPSGVPLLPPSGLTPWSLLQICYAILALALTPLLANRWATSAQQAIGHSKPMIFVGCDVFAGTLVAIAIATIPLALLLRWKTATLRVCARPLLLAILRMGLLYGVLKFELSGYWDPTPRWPDLLLLAPVVPVLAVALTALAICATALDHGIRTSIWDTLRKLHVQRVALVAGLAWFMWTFSSHYNNIASPGILVVPFGAAVVVAGVTIFAGRDDESVWGTALFGVLFATCTMAVILPLR